MTDKQEELLEAILLELKALNAHFRAQLPIPEEKGEPVPREHPLLKEATAALVKLQEQYKDAPTPELEQQIKDHEACLAKIS